MWSRNLSIVLIRRAYKDLLRTDDNRRLYVVPESGKEANDFASFEHQVRGKTELWPCHLITRFDRDKKEVTVFRYRAEQAINVVLDDVEAGLRRASKQLPRETLLPESAVIKLMRPFGEDQWDLHTRSPTRSWNFFLSKFLPRF